MAGLALGFAGRAAGFFGKLVGHGGGTAKAAEELAGAKNKEPALGLDRAEKMPHGKELLNPENMKAAGKGKAAEGAALDETTAGGKAAAAKKAMTEQHAADAAAIPKEERPAALKKANAQSAALERAQADENMNFEKQLENPALSDTERTAIKEKQTATDADYSAKLEVANSKAGALESQVKKDGGIMGHVMRNGNAYMTAGMIGVPLAPAAYGEAKSLFGGSAAGAGAAGAGDASGAAGDASATGAATDASAAAPVSDGAAPYDPFTGAPNPEYAARSFTA